MSSLTKTLYPKTSNHNPLTGICLFLLLFVFAPVSTLAQLSPGDIAFTGYNADGDDQFSFIATTNIPGGEVIYFTDRGWVDENSNWNSEEGIIKFTVSAEGMITGDMVVIEYISSSNHQILQGEGTLVSESGSYTLSTEGDQIFAFQTEDTENYTPSFIAGINMNNKSGADEINWGNIDATNTSSNETDLPDALTNGLNAIWVHEFNSWNTERDNAKYNNTITQGTKNEIATAVNTLSNWELDDSTPFTLGYPTTTATAYDGNWNEVATWNNGIPGKITDVTLGHSVTAPVDCEVQNASVNAGAMLAINTGVEFTCASLTLESDATQSASLINEGTFNGEVSYKRYLTGGRWYLVSPPVSGQSISGFLTNEDNHIPQKEASRGMMDYSTANDGWNDYFTDATGGSLNPGMGYGARRETDGSFVFTGNPVSSQVNVAVSDAGNAWNLLGNPYPAAINATDAADAENNFLAINDENLDPSYTALYLWDEAEGYSTGGYKIINNAESGSDKLLQDYLQGAQGFFVKARPGISQFEFTPEMRSHQPDIDLKSGNNPWPQITVTVKSEDKTAGTIFLFHESMTKGLDVGYDAGAFKNQSGLALFSKLIEDNGVDFSLQCLPTEFEKTMSIPLVVVAENGKQISFSIEVDAWPEAIEIGIKDMENNSLKKFQTDSDGFETMANEKSSGRFFLLVGENLATNINNEETGIIIYPDVRTNKIIVRGIPENKINISIFDLAGRKVMSQNLSGGMVQQIDFNGYHSGIYIISCQSDNFTLRKKIYWMK